jgi:mannose-6-phosphate isomerase
MMTQVFKLKNKIQNYDWGTRGEKAFIPLLTGSPVEAGKPYAELWMGTHPNAPSIISIDGGKITLSDAIGKYAEELVGYTVINRFGASLPFLFKVLSAGEPLSIQAHPNKAQAEILHDKNPENYPDSNHKPEIAIALDELHALCGFKPFEKIIAVLSEYPELLQLSNLDLKNNSLSNKEFIRQLYSSFMLSAKNNEKIFKSVLDSIENKIRQKTIAFCDAEKLFLEMKLKYGYDVGLFSVFLLNYLILKNGEGVFIDAGIPHAYLKGNLIECMANSDNVVRAGFTPKFKDVETLLEVLTYDDSLPQVISPSAGNLTTVYPAPVEEFRIIKYISDENIQIIHSANDRPAIFIIIQGGVNFTLKNGNEIKHVEFNKGESFFAPALLGEIEMKVLPDSIVYKAETGI